MIDIQWSEATARAEGSIWRKVRCAHCETAYVFRVRITIQHKEVQMYSSGSPDQVERAQKTARYHLGRQLKKKVVPVPCPSCYSYQENMCEELRKQRYGWIYTPAMFLLTIGGFGVMGAICSATDARHRGIENIWWLALSGAVAFGIGVAAFVVRRILWARYNPNTRITADHRMAIAQDEAMTEAEFARRHPAATAVEMK